MSRRTMIAAFAAPVVALVAAGIGAAVASPESPAYGAATERLDALHALANAEATFRRADLDGSGALDAHEYSSLATVTAELARLNGFVAVEAGQSPQIVLLPISAPQALAGAERTRVDAVSRTNFYAIAGDDARITLDEYLSDQKARFADADVNGNGSLTNAELVSFVAREALLSKADV